jgi:hypothetical protein
LTRVAGPRIATTSLALLDGKNTARALFIADETGSSTTRAISSLGAASSKEKNDWRMGPSLAHCSSRGVAASHRWEASTSARPVT